MKKLKIEEGANVEIKDSAIAVTGGGKTFDIHFSNRIMSISVADGEELVFSLKGKQTRPKYACMLAIIAHVKNAFKGIKNDFTKNLKVIYSHFPVTLEVKGGVTFIKNFLGEKLPRSAKIIGDTKVKVNGQDIELSGSDKYAVGQTANNLMTATFVRKKDRRVFQDGIYPVN